MSKLVKHFSRFGRDGYDLARAFAANSSNYTNNLNSNTNSTTPMNRIKPILLDQARQSNSVAHSLLKMDKEVGLVKYYGLSGYIKQRWRLKSSKSSSAAPGNLNDDTNTNTSANSVSTSGPTTSTSVSTSNGGGGVKIAFMVTASMKQELNERLGYNADQIKQMTPLEASLILSQSIPHGEVQERLPLAVQEFESQRQKEHEEQARVQQQQLEQQQQQGLHYKLDPPSTIVHRGSTHSTSEVVRSSSYASNNVLHTEQGGSGFGDVWYEVTETKNGNKSRVGLYLDEKEAEVGLRTRQEIAKSKSLNLQYEMFRITTDQL